MTTQLDAAKTRYLAAKTALLACIDDSRRVYAGDVLLDLAEQETALELLAHCERASRDEFGSSMMARLLATLKAHAATVTQ